MRRPCFECEQTGFLDWADKQEEPCPNGCLPPEPMTDKQKTAYLRTLELADSKTRPAGSRTRPASEADDRRFTKMLFCGAGERTRYDVACLHDRIETALNFLSGRQQGPHWHEQPSQEMLDLEEADNRKADLVCEQVVRDIAVALTGKEITFVE